MTLSSQNPRPRETRQVQPCLLQKRWSPTEQSLSATVMTQRVQSQAQIRLLLACQMSVAIAMSRNGPCQRQRARRRTQRVPSQRERQSSPCVRSSLQTRSYQEQQIPIQRELNRRDQNFAYSTMIPEAKSPEQTMTSRRVRILLSTRQNQDEQMTGLKVMNLRERSQVRIRTTPLEQSSLMIVMTPMRGHQAQRVMSQKIRTQGRTTMNRLVQKTVQTGMTQPHQIPEQIWRSQAVRSSSARVTSPSEQSRGLTNR
mmetsp:Transcript_37944/g.87702  ORF Transcript_37944/g.87702 Transcript_37944/m.87702 type:complete len:256 (+) Transcript_37944:2910-3677(+)